MFHPCALLRWGLLTGFAAIIPTSSVAQGPAIEWSTLMIRAGEGQREFPFGRLRVPENHAEPDGPAITLAFVRLPSTNPRPGPPLIYLAGGPGGSAIGEAAIPYLFSLFDALRAVGDVILLDQRGTGRTSPNLSCRGETAAPVDLFLSEATMRAHAVRGIEACAAVQRGRQVRAQYYTTPQSADDVDALRRALGVERISLLGFSYGTHLGLSVIRRHGDRIARAVLAGVEGPDHSEKWPSVMDLQLERLAHYAREDSTIGRMAPDLVGTLRTLLDRLEREPARVPSSDQPGAPQLLVGRAGFQYLLFRDLGDTNDWPALPGLIVTAANGEYGLLGQFARRRWNQMRGTSLMGAAMDCASGASPERRAQVVREAQTALLGNMMNYFDDAACRAAGAADLGPEYRSRIWSAVPTLFVSGTLDSQTPPHQAEEVRWGFSRGAHLVVGNAGHESTLNVPEVVAAIIRFLQGEDLTDRRIELPRPQFRGPRR